MIEFFRKFFGYYRYEKDGIIGIPEPFKDDLGNGAFTDLRHFIWIGLVILLSLLLYKIFKKQSLAGRKTIVILSVLLFSVRLVNQIVRVIVGAEYPGWRAFPFHMCTVMSFLLPIVVVFNLKRLKTPIYTLSMMGGIVTVLMGDYFNNAFLTFSAFEGMWAHTVLILVPIIEISINEFKFEFKKSWTVLIAILTLMFWATLANNIFFEDYDPNYMYLKKNGLPDNLGGDYYFLIYTAVFIFLFSLIYGIPTLYKNKKS